ncbi:hypothetical protein MKZ38_003936 [Zalerion maritima]|uniref:Ubiquitin thioesterase OTU n=1 Tax=Zalerion maritima TaxID=339359 RepID=A0AAD5WS14_9PEZI|nr:hypothetical protein MKZ38_003936 [Zalerion maritima]
MRIRYKSPKGNGIMTFHETATVENLTLQLYCETGTEKFEIRYGWPPKPLDLKAKDVSLVSLKMNGETLTVVIDEPEPTAAASISKPAKEEARIKLNRKKTVDAGDVVIPWPEREGALILRVMPDDNSCLFTAFGGVFQKENASASLRREVASSILANPEIYNEVVLEMSPERYCSLITQPDRWGGAIELGILCDIYDIEICSVDVKSGRVDRFGQGKEKRCILCYSGIHYDRIAFSFCPPPHTSTDMPVTTDVTNWLADDDEVLIKAVELAQKLKGMHYFTDTTDFVLKCNVPGCNWIGSGDRQAKDHMKSMGHTSLSEMQIS